MHTDRDDNQVKVGAWTWTVWPTAPLPSLEWIIAQGRARGPAWVNEFHRKREEAIAREAHDPLIYGWEQPPVKIIRELLAGTYVPGRFGISLVEAGWRQRKPANDVLGLGGNGSGKTDYQAKLAMEMLVERPNSEVRCFSQNEQTSVRYIQRAMYRYLPPALRKVKRLGNAKISFNPATGFSENIFILPNMATALFPTYKGYQQDPNSVEGGEADMATWDEEAPASLLKTLRFRVHKKGGVMLGGFTPVGGYTATVAEYIEGGRIIECIPARDVEWDWWQRTWGWGRWLLPERKELVKGCPPGHLPLVVESGQGGGRRFAVVLPTMFNPYTKVSAIIESVQGSTLEFALERLWGWPTKLARKAFPNFGDVHIVAPERIPPLKTLTVWQWVDPHGDRNWFMNWTGVDAQGVKWTFLEWPSAAEGDWAVPGEKPDGKAGPAQTIGGGKSFNDYKRLIYELEGWERTADGGWRLGERQRTPEHFESFEVFDRQMDPRPAGTSVPSDEDSRTFIDHMGDPIRGRDGKRQAPGLDFRAGPDCSVEEGKQWVNEWINTGWDPNQPVDPMNCPKWYIASTCVNTIWALRTFTGVDGLKGACKDPIDCLKGLSKAGIRHVQKGALGTVGAGHSY
jgi:hypothetical protein